MASDGSANNLMQDAFQETAVQYATKLLDKGAEALRLPQRTRGPWREQQLIVRLTSNQCWPT